MNRKTSSVLVPLHGCVQVTFKQQLKVSSESKLHLETVRSVPGRSQVAYVIIT